MHVVLCRAIFTCMMQRTSAFDVPQHVTLTDVIAWWA